MDLLGDIGAEDQLISARSENAVLQDRVKRLTARVKELTLENESLRAEVEIYRKEAALPNFSKLALGKSTDTNDSMETEESIPEEFVRSGNGVYCSQIDVSLKNLHGSCNPLTCSLSPDDTILASGGADAHVALVPWGAALNTEPDHVVKSACRIRCDAPVICLAFSPTLRGVLAAGCMDGTLQLIYYSTFGSQIQANRTPAPENCKHGKYVRVVAWSSKDPVLASSSADGTVHVYKVEKSGMEMNEVKLSKLESLHLSGAVESICFAEDQLICYARGTPYLSSFDIKNDFKQTKINLNGASGNATGGFEDHVSFAVMDMVPYQNKYLAVATDTSRNIVLDLQTGRVIRNLYGHKNDGFSQPKLAWSANGQYIIGNTQEEPCLCVWDIASTKLIRRLEGHSSPIRDLYSSPSSDILVSTAFDKTTKVWFPPNDMQ